MCAEVRDLRQLGWRAARIRNLVRRDAVSQLVDRVEVRAAVDLCEGAVTGSRAGDHVEGLQGFGLDYGSARAGGYLVDADEVGAQIGEEEVAAGGIRDDEVRVRHILSVGDGAGAGHVEGGGEGEVEGVVVLVTVVAGVVEEADGGGVTVRSE